VSKVIPVTEREKRTVPEENRRRIAFAEGESLLPLPVRNSIFTDEKG